MDVWSGIHQMDSPNSAVAGLDRRPVLRSLGVRPSDPWEYNRCEAAAYLTISVIRPLVGGTTGLGTAPEADTIPDISLFLGLNYIPRHP